MKKTAKLIFIISFFLVCCVPVLTMPFVDIQRNSENEKRQTASFPKVISDNSLNLKYFNEIDNYLNDNFNFRISLNSLNSTLFEKIFNTSANDDVIIGKNNWLYFNETLNDYTRKNTLSDTKINQINKTLTIVNDYVESCGAKFVFTIAPNKNSVYPQNMPWFYSSPNEESNAQKLAKTFDDDFFCSLYDVLENSETTTYLTRDSHWNNFGAYLGFCEILEKLELEQNFKITNQTKLTDYSSDLDLMLYPNGGVLDEQIYYEFDSEYDFVSRFKSTDDLIIQTTCDTGKNSVLVFRDSFGKALLDFFALEFENCELSRVVPYNLLECENYDYVVLEIVERNIPNLLKTAPKMPAQIKTPTKTLKAQDAEIFTEKAGDYNHIYGYFSGESENVYICVNENYYQAFPILEDELELDDENIQGFSAYLPKDISTENIIIKSEK